MNPLLPEQVLVVDDSRALCRYLGARLAEVAEVTVASAGTLADARALLAADPGRFFVAVLDLNLPDAPDGEIVDALRASNLPLIVLTGSLDDALRARILSKPQVIDYVLKSNASEVHYVARLVRRLRRNRAVKVLIVDDSASFRC